MTLALLYALRSLLHVPSPLCFSWRPDEDGDGDGDGDGICKHVGGPSVYYLARHGSSSPHAVHSVRELPACARARCLQRCLLSIVKVKVERRSRSRCRWAAQVQVSSVNARLYAHNGSTRSEESTARARAATDGDFSLITRPAQSRRYYTGRSEIAQPAVSEKDRALRRQRFSPGHSIH